MAFLSIFHFGRVHQYYQMRKWENEIARRGTLRAKGFFFELFNTINPGYSILFMLFSMFVFADAMVVFVNAADKVQVTGRTPAEERQRQLEMQSTSAQARLDALQTEKLSREGAFASTRDIQ